MDGIRKVSKHIGYYRDYIGKGYGQYKAVKRQYKTYITRYRPYIAAISFYKDRRRSL